jgi:diaminohydroxyphosphoribosylaminopyrimidine deaminase/5-amino-6-(5-phosphoribosylamino)uracil reductase
MVGAVVVRHGEILGEGYHACLGGPHAEVVALAAAAQRGGSRGATVYVTLEPCGHHGRTPPCAEALIEAGVARVVACHGDPNPAVAGQGFERLRAAGIAVESGLLVEEAVRLNLPFLVFHALGRPLVTLKWAMSLDGRIATVDGESQWISSEEGRRWSLGLREEHAAILVGVGTALADDPSLNRRLGWAEAPPEAFSRVILDRRLRLPPTARLLTLPGPVLVYAEEALANNPAALRAAGAEVVLLPRVDPAAVLADLHRRGVQSVLVEGGGGIHGAFVEAGLFDRVAVDCAPRLLGGESALGPVGGQGIGALAAAPRLEGLSAEECGPDIILRGLRQGCLQDLCKSVAE